MLAVSASDWFQVIYIVLSLIFSAIGIAGIYSKCREYIKWYALWQYPATVAAFYFAWQLYALILTPSGLETFLTALGVSEAVIKALVAFATDNPDFYSIVVLVLFAAYGAGLIWSLFEWNEAACADCVIVDCDCECGWFKVLIDILGTLIPVSAGSIFDRLFAGLKSLFSGGSTSASKSFVPKSTNADSFKAATEKVTEAV